LSRKYIVSTIYFNFNPIDTFLLTLEHGFFFVLFVQLDIEPMANIFVIDTCSAGTAY